MTLTAHTAPQGVLLTTADLRQFEDDVVRLESEIERLMREREMAQKILEAAKLLAARAPILSEPQDQQPTPPAAPATTPPAKVTRRRRASAGPTWNSVILKAVKASELGLTYAEVRKAVDASPLGPRLRTSSKGYHNAIGRLAREGSLVRQHGRLFTPSAFKKFESAVEEGVASIVVPQPFAHSPMGEAILRIVQRRPGIAGRDIIEELRKDAEFNATLTPHHTGAYNIIARLVKRRQVIRRDDGGCIPGPDFPRELVGTHPDGVGALNGKSASAPSTGRDYPSLPFPQPASSGAH